MCYKFQNALEVKEVLGFDLRTIQKFGDLSESHKQLAEKLICNFINGHGLKVRERIKLISITRELNKFRLYYEDGSVDVGYSNLYDNGSVG